MTIRCENMAADLLICHWSDGKDETMNVNVVNHLKVALIKGLANTHGNDLTRIYAEKISMVMVRGAEELG